MDKARMIWNWLLSGKLSRDHGTVVCRFEHCPQPLIGAADRTDAPSEAVDKVSVCVNQFYDILHSRRYLSL